MTNQTACFYCHRQEPEVELVPMTVWWSAWGQNAGDLNWWKHEGSVPLCEECEDENWARCHDCASYLRADFAGYGYEYPDGKWHHEVYCPDCVEKNGARLTAGTGPPPRRVTGREENGKCSWNECVLHGDYDD